MIRIIKTCIFKFYCMTLTRVQALGPEFYGNKFELLQIKIN